MSSQSTKKKAKTMTKPKGIAKKPVKSIPIPAAIESSNFELELCWCIHQLESSLQSGKLNEREASKIEKAIKTLKSPTEIFIKKRQLMQQLLGNYREKMKSEEKKLAINPNQIKMTVAKPSKKSVFVKKSAFSTSCKDFRFNFPIDAVNKLDLSDTTKKDCIDDVITSDSQIDSGTDDFHFVPSRNTFRFHFVMDDIEKES